MLKGKFMCLGPRRARELASDKADGSLPPCVRPEIWCGRIRGLWSLVSNEGLVRPEASPELATERRGLVQGLINRFVRRCRLRSRHHKHRRRQAFPRPLPGEGRAGALHEAKHAPADP